MSKCSRHHLQYFYNASAYGLAGEIERPTRHSIPMQAATALAGSGGRGFQQIDNFSAPPYVSFKSAYTEVGGSFDDCHNKHTTFSYSVIEGLNIAGMITADRIVARMAIYSPEVNVDDESSQNGTATGQSGPSKKKNIKKSSSNSLKEHAFDITGSYFDNLVIAGHKIDVQLATQRLHEYQTYEDLAGAMKNGANDLLPWGDLDEPKLETLEEQESDYHAIQGFSARARQWNTDKEKRCTEGMYWISAAGHYDLSEKYKKSELCNFGGIICIPKFGVVHLAEITVHKDRRQLHMLRVAMCSTSGGHIVGGGSGGGGTSMPPP
jgi:hypothetical protein